MIDRTICKMDARNNGNKSPRHETILITFSLVLQQGAILLSCQEHDAFLVTATWVSQQSDSQPCVENLAFCTDWLASASSCAGIGTSIPILCFILEKPMVFCHRVRKFKEFLAIEANCLRNTLKLYVQLTKKPLKSTVTSNFFEATCIQF